MSMHENHGGDLIVFSLPLSDPRCNNDSCRAFEVAHKESQAAVSYYWQYEYGHWTTWLYLAIIFLFMLLFIFQSWHDRHPRLLSNPQTSAFNRTVAIWRTFSYRRYRGHVADRLGLPSFGLQLLFLTAIIFAAVASFAVRPYYRERRGYGSPPLGVRAGLMAIALTPIIVALSGKVNIITLLTGIGYEKLNVIHRWVAWICFGLSVVHTIPFIVAPLKEGGLAVLHEQFYSKGAFEYTGVPPLAMLFFLSVFSIPYVRARIYECFVHSHILAAVAYLGLMFWHTGNLEDSWVYLWATLAIWLATLLVRVFYKNSILSIRRNWFEGFSANAKSIPGDMIRLEVFVPKTLTWNPGQHCFLRIPSLSLLDNHPFTIASSSTAAGESGKFEGGNLMVFLIRPHKGFTMRLSRYSHANVDVSFGLFVDGPYGGLPRRIENAFDSVILVAGGGGITASVSWLEQLVRRMKSHTVAVRKIKLAWAVRKNAHLLWVEEELKNVLDLAPKESLSLDFYVTDENEASLRAEKQEAHSEDAKYATCNAQDASTPRTVDLPEIATITM
ncbi:MAG: hypothetical protein Q9214_005098, partial [Letrouitia sp. 1 TL-2023]